MPRNNNFFEHYISTPSPAGYVGPAQKIWTDYVSAYMDPKKDYFIHDKSYGGVAAIIKGASDYRVALDTHVDQIHLMVQRIEENGHIGISAQGGIDLSTLLARDVFIHTQNGPVRGTFDIPAIHVRGDEEPKPAEADMTINIGAADTAEATAMGIAIGQPVLYAEGIRYKGPKNDLIVAPGLDDKICGFATANIVRKLKEQNITLPYTLCVVNSAQEETGLRGAAIMAQKIKPDIAIALDVTFDTTGPGYNPREIGDIRVGHGPALCMGAMLQKNITDHIAKTAAKHDMPIQFETLHKGDTSGTNADSYAYHGAATALLSLPIYNMHTPAETASLRDVDTMQNILIATLRDITGNPSQFDAVSDVMAPLAKRFPNGPK